MCKIWDDVRKEGHERGLAEGHEKGLAEGEMKERIKSIKQLMKNLQCNIEKAMQILAIPENDWDLLKEIILQ